jgi:hypothetical protein
MAYTVARPNKTVGRVLLGPRVVKTGYVRIVAAADGSGRLELFDAALGTWREAADACSFDELWRAAAVFDSGYLAAAACTLRRRVQP